MGARRLSALSISCGGVRRRAAAAAAAAAAAVSLPRLSKETERGCERERERAVGGKEERATRKYLPVPWNFWNFPSSKLYFFACWLSSNCLKAIEATRTRFTSKTTVSRGAFSRSSGGEKERRGFFLFWGVGGGVKGERGEGNWTYRKAVRRREEEETVKWTPDALPVYLRTHPQSCMTPSQKKPACSNGFDHAEFTCSKLSYILPRLKYQILYWPNSQCAALKVVFVSGWA